MKPPTWKVCSQGAWCPLHRCRGRCRHSPITWHAREQGLCTVDRGCPVAVCRPALRSRGCANPALVRSHDFSHASPASVAVVPGGVAALLGRCGAAGVALWHRSGHVCETELAWQVPARRCVWHELLCRTVPPRSPAIMPALVRNQITAPPCRWPVRRWAAPSLPNHGGPAASLPASMRSASSSMNLTVASGPTRSAVALSSVPSFLKHGGVARFVRQRGRWPELEPCIRAPGTCESRPGSAG